MHKDPRIQALFDGTNRLLVKNCNMSVKDIEDMTREWKTTKKTAPIAASFNHIKDLEEKHITHFRAAPYLFKPLQGNIFGGMLLDDSLEYVHLVLLSEAVLTYILDLKK
jgi:hypothetical protein